MSELNFNEVLKSLDSSLFVSNSGMRKENIYKKDVFSNCLTDRDKKTIRRKIRNIIENFMKSILTQKDPVKLKKLCEQFDIFYKATYQNNDYSFDSLASKNTDETKKENLIKMLEICKKQLINNTKSTKTSTKKETNINQLQIADATK